MATYIDLDTITYDYEDYCLTGISTGYMFDPTFGSFRTQTIDIEKEITPP